MVRRRKKSKQDELNIADVVDIDATAIDAHFISVPAELAYFNEKYAVALEKYLRAKVEADFAHSTAYKAARVDADLNGKKVTEAVLAAEVQTSVFYIDARNTLVEAEGEKQRARGRVDAIIAKKDMLVSLGAHIRAELSDPMVRQQARDTRQLTNVL